MKWAVVIMALVLFIYIIFLIVNGYSYIRILERAREDWKIRIVKYLPQDDYKDLVEDPIGEAVKSYMIASVIAAGISILIIIGMFVSTVAS